GRLRKHGAPHTLPAATASNSATFTSPPTDNGRYVITLLASDKDTAHSTDSATVTVTNADPSAAVLGVPDSSPEGTPINLTAVGTDAGSADCATLTSTSTA